jgi:hypothetical protein
VTDEECVHRYAMLGVVGYVENHIRIWLIAHDGIPPTSVIMGQLEWDVMGAKGADDWSIAGVRVIPDAARPAGVELV